METQRLWSGLHWLHIRWASKVKQTYQCKLHLSHYCGCFLQKGGWSSVDFQSVALWPRRRQEADPDEASSRANEQTDSFRLTLRPGKLTLYSRSVLMSLHLKWTEANRSVTWLENSRMFAINKFKSKTAPPAWKIFYLLRDANFLRFLEAIPTLPWNTQRKHESSLHRPKIQMLQ